MNFSTQIKLAFRAIQGNLLRSILTALIIAIGIMALVGILTSLEVMKTAINTTFSRMGANTISIVDYKNVRGRGSHGQSQSFKPISFNEAEKFKERYNYYGTVSIAMGNSPRMAGTHKSEKTNPDITIQGVDLHFTETESYTFAEGRKFSVNEDLRGSAVTIIGMDLCKLLFPSPKNALGQMLQIAGSKYKIIGVLQSRGSSLVSNDRFALIPLKNARARMPVQRLRFQIRIRVEGPEQMEPATQTAINVLRGVRRLDTRDENNFDIRRSDNLANSLIENLSDIAMAAGLIGVITLFGAAIALMNILLVSVSERTREIGVSKAIGAKQADIIGQFLTEACAICFIGGVTGILLGILLGNSVGIYFDIQFIVPWKWMFSGLGLCFFVGIAAGLYPAIKASRLDPIEALRYE